MTKKEYLLGLLAEESLEVAHRVHKALRFGLEETQPGYTRNNKDRIMEELTDLFTVISVLAEEGILPDGEELASEKYEWLNEHEDKKEEKIKKYLDYSTKQGIING